MKTIFGTWFEELKILAAKRKCECLVTCKDDHREAFEQGLTPKQHLNEMLQDAIS
jgi:hypothetical protein